MSGSIDVTKFLFASVPFGPFVEKCWATVTGGMFFLSLLSFKQTMEPSYVVFKVRDGECFKVGGQ